MTDPLCVIVGYCARCGEPIVRNAPLGEGSTAEPPERYTCSCHLGPCQYDNCTAVNRVRRGDGVPRLALTSEELRAAIERATANSARWVVWHGSERIA